ncbi:MAG: chromosome partitioning protein ParB, partial [Candidatus Omnitrophica bacterium]|nr:chromosome partitioning protein ParB [Candidatus Omnitrophota bacterium]
ARSLLSLGSLDEQTKMYDLILKKGLSVREVENLVKKETGGGARREKLSPAKDHELIALEEELQKKLGTKVRLLTAKKRGKIVIEYYSIDDLDRILKLMGKN